MAGRRPGHLDFLGSAIHVGMPATSAGMTESSGPDGPLVAAISEPDCLESRVSRYREQRGGADVKHIELESGLNH
jgi:hypothetical protein